MTAKKILSLYGLKWNPFTPDLPVEALKTSPKVEHFLWRIEQLVSTGGFAMVTGESGLGKSVTLRLLAERLAALSDVVVGTLTRPQSQTGDFYRELGELFSVPLSPANRYGGFKALRDRWRAHVASSLLRPVLLIDEAQEMRREVLIELRLLASADFDSTNYLTVVFAGDPRLPALLRQDDLLPLGSRIRTRLLCEPASAKELAELLGHLLSKAGNPQLMTPGLATTLAEHSAGNPRVLMNTAAELLMAAVSQEADRLDEKLYLEVFQTPAKPRKRARA